MSNLDLVTGGAGFIGSHLSRVLLGQGRRVRVLDNLSTGSLDNIADLLRADGDRLEFLKMDLLDDGLVGALRGVDTVYHQAAIPSVERSIKDPLTSNRTNIGGTLNLFEEARKSGVRRVVYASSSSVYGDTPTLPKSETMTPSPISPYAVTKRSTELYGRVYSEVMGLETIGLRYFNVFGPYQDPSSDYAAVIPRFITRMLAGKAPVVYGDGEQSRDFTYVEDVVRANIAAAKSDVSGLSLNIACGRQYSLNDLILFLNGILGTAFEGIHEPPRPGDVRHSLAEISEARRSIGYSPTVSFEEGLRRTVEWFKKQVSRQGQC